MSLADHLEKLRHFHKLTQYRSINEGAQKMGISQAGLSKSIANLESVLDTPLFVRSRDGLTLTKEGELLLASTKRILDEASQFEANLRSLQAVDIPQRIVVGMYDSIAIYFFPDLERYLKSIYPSVELQLVVDKSSSLAEMVEAGEIDLAVGVNLAKKKKKTEFYLLFEDHYSFYVVPSIKVNPRVPLLYHPHATDENDTDLSRMLQSLIKSRLCHQVYNFETLKMLTSLGSGIGVLPTRVAQPLVNQKQIVQTTIAKIPNLFGKHTIGFLVSDTFLKQHRAFTEDIYRLGERWAKT